jgi:hypothetical protein
MFDHQIRAASTEQLVRLMRAADITTAGGADLGVRIARELRYRNRFAGLPSGTEPKGPRLRLLQQNRRIAP